LKIQCAPKWPNVKLKLVGIGIRDFSHGSPFELS
jgi:hypothetical protein